jgi:hypothetical protein
MSVSVERAGDRRCCSRNWRKEGGGKGERVGEGERAEVVLM